MKEVKKDVKIAFRKPFYPVSDGLRDYLEKYNRLTKIDLEYDDLLRFTDGSVVLDLKGKDTLWRSVYYNPTDFDEIREGLKRIYTLLHSDGDRSVLPYLTVDSIDYCTFGNSKPFRIRVRNILNDIHTNFYIKKVDASRIYGLEMEDLLSPNRANYLVNKDTLIEEHIWGIPGDIFIEEYLPNCSELDKTQLAKEFVKFNERCLTGLLGDMRSYNYVVVPTHDFDRVVYRIRPIDFDQQCYEGNLKIYMPQYFKENFKMVDLVLKKLQPKSIEQYRTELRSLLVKRVTNSIRRFEYLVAIMRKDFLAPHEHVVQLRTALQKLTYNSQFRHCETMGDIVNTGISFIVKNYKRPD
ncbi:MAG: hypothetical protein KF870_08160 [Leadbetterella sp.]|nr:hypothetical protein [Leadbetterella sp.]